MNHLQLKYCRINVEFSWVHVLLEVSSTQIRTKSLYNLFKKFAKSCNTNPYYANLFFTPLDSILEFSETRIISLKVHFKHTKYQGLIYSLFMHKMGSENCLSPFLRGECELYIEKKCTTWSTFKTFPTHILGKEDTYSTVGEMAKSWI